jgi:regulator of protease activity HflC (stomatin/prohibitin superfamily)
VLKKTLLLLLASIVLFDFTGCAMSAQARRERAYRHYVAKQTKQRQKAIARAQKEANREMKQKMKHVQPSDPYVTTSVQDYQEMPSVFDQPSAETAAPSANPTHSKAPTANPSESVAPPVTVSASNDINVMATQNPDQPSPP